MNSQLKISPVDVINRKKEKRKRMRVPVFIMSFLFIYAVISLYPMFYMIFYSLKTTEEIFYSNPFGIPLSPEFSNYSRAINSFDMIVFFQNSIIVTILSVLGTLILALPLSYALTRMNWKMRKHVSFYITLGLFIPVQVIIIPLAILVKDLHLSNSYWALILPYIAFNLAFTTMIISSSFNNMPKELEESAVMDGANIFVIFTKIMIPLVKPAIATTVIFAVLNVWNEYTLASIFATSNDIKTLPIGLASFVGQRSTDWGAMGACMVLASIPTIILYLLFSEQIENSLTVGGAVKG